MHATQSYGVSVENVFAVETNAGPSYDDIKNLPNKYLLWCGKALWLLFVRFRSLFSLVLDLDSNKLKNLLVPLMCRHSKFKLA